MSPSAEEEVKGDLGYGAQRLSLTGGDLAASPPQASTDLFLDTSANFL